MYYDTDSLKRVKEEYEDVAKKHNQLKSRLMHFQSKLMKSDSQVYLTQGVARRLGILVRCIDNIFRIYPVERTKKLLPDELTDLTINLHAFFVNTSGIFDNLGWVFVCEHNLSGKRKDGKLERKDIGLFNKKTQLHLTKNLREYLQSTDLQTWYANYSKNYRDALAHRIPLYVPPAILNENEGEKYKKLQDKLQTLGLYSPEGLKHYGDILDQQTQLGEISPFFAHLPTAGGTPVFFHAQVIVDYKTIEELVIKFCEAYIEANP